MRKVLNYPAIDILVELLKHHFLILAALVYIYSLNIIMFPHLLQIYLDYFQRLGQLARAENELFTQQIIAIAIALYSSTVFYFVTVLVRTLVYTNTGLQIPFIFAAGFCI